MQGYGAELLAGRPEDHAVPSHATDHSHLTAPPRPRSGAGPVRLTLSRRGDIAAPPVSACAEDPLAGFTASALSVAPETTGANR